MERPKEREGQLRSEEYPIVYRKGTKKEGCAIMRDAATGWLRLDTLIG